MDVPWHRSWRSRPARSARPDGCVADGSCSSSRSWVFAALVLFSAAAPAQDVDAATTRLTLTLEEPSPPVGRARPPSHKRPSATCNSRERPMARQRKRRRTVPPATIPRTIRQRRARRVPDHRTGPMVPPMVPSDSSGSRNGSTVRVATTRSVEGKRTVRITTAVRMSVPVSLVSGSSSNHRGDRVLSAEGETTEGLRERRARIAGTLDRRRHARSSTVHRQASAESLARRRRDRTRSSTRRSRISRGTSASSSSRTPRRRQYHQLTSLSRASPTAAQPVAEPTTPVPPAEPVAQSPPRRSLEHPPRPKPRPPKTVTPPVPEACRVPIELVSLVGRTHDDVLAWLGSLSITLAATKVPSSKPEGEVLQRQPGYPAQLRCGDTLKLTLSDGSLVIVPAVTSLEIKQAQAAIVDAKSHRGVDGSGIRSMHPAQCSSRRPSPAAKCRRGSTVRIAVASGLVVPDVTRLGLVEAMQRLQAFRVVPSRIKSDLDKDTVASQSPLGGSRAAAGSPVSIGVSLGPWCRRGCAGSRWPRCLRVPLPCSRHFLPKLVHVNARVDLDGSANTETEVAAEGPNLQIDAHLERGRSRVLFTGDAA